MVRSPERYRYSGDHAYLQGKATETIDPATVLSMLGGKQAYRRFVRDGLSEGHIVRAFDIGQPRSGLRSDRTSIFNSFASSLAAVSMGRRVSVLPDKSGSFFSNLSPNPSAPKNLWSSTA
jgi:hypothetical protein